MTEREVELSRSRTNLLSAWTRLRALYLDAGHEDAYRRDQNAIAPA